MVSSRILIEELRRLRAARELQNDLLRRLDSSKDEKNTARVQKRLLYAREQVLRSTFKLRQIIQQLEEGVYAS